MALLSPNKINRVEKDRNSIHQEVECTYTTFIDKDGNKYIQFDTYGSQNRKIKDKVSQSIQLNEKAAMKLIQIIKDELKLK
jgi:hypothetical protein